MQKYTKDEYHDDYGNRIKLDTRYLDWCSKHAAPKKKPRNKIVPTIIHLAVIVLCIVIIARYYSVVLANADYLLEIFDVFVATFIIIYSVVSKLINRR